MTADHLPARPSPVPATAGRYVVSRADWVRAVMASRLPTAHRAVLLVLSYAASPAGLIASPPGRRTLARATGLAVTEVDQVLAELDPGGWVALERTQVHRRIVSIQAMRPASDAEVAP